VLKRERDPLVDYPELKRWFAAMDARPAVSRARAAIFKEHIFKAAFDEEAKHALFPSHYPPARAA
jgi:GST-like protein